MLKIHALCRLLESVLDGKGRVATLPPPRPILGKAGRPDDKEGNGSMMRYATGLIAVMCLVGCRAPAPSFNAFAPYGTPHVAPPTTGSVGTPNSY
jgi:hypothetical protein